MKQVYSIGDKVRYSKTVLEEDVAAFSGVTVHSVCSTFVLAREIEWTTRQFVLEMKEDDEEGIGTSLTIEHKAPAFIGEKIEFTGIVDSINGNELICSYEARVGERLIAIGKTGQKILKKSKLASILSPKKHE